VGRRNRNQQEQETTVSEEQSNTEVVTETAPTVEVTTSAPAETQAAASDKPAVPDERYKLVKHPETGAMVKRIDYIKELWTVKKWARGAIAKHLTEITGKKVTYQIVFAATKKLAGGPDKPAEPAPAAQAA
jgi:3-oxoacyl-ACP reductase-like protein